MFGHQTLPVWLTLTLSPVIPLVKIGWKMKMSGNRIGGRDVEGGKWGERQKRETKIHFQVNDFTYNYSKVSRCVSTISCGHDSRALFSIAWIGTIFVYAVDCNGVNTVNVTIVSATVFIHTTISNSKGVNSTQSTSTLKQTKHLIKAPLFFSCTVKIYFVWLALIEKWGVSH